jgi:hypothetical protein
VWFGWCFIVHKANSIHVVVAVEVRIVGFVQCCVVNVGAVLFALFYKPNATEDVKVWLFVQAPKVVLSAVFSARFHFTYL